MTRMTNVVYSMTNASDHNEVLCFIQIKDGSLEHIQSYDTGGKGSSEPMVDPLASQGSLIISTNRQFLLVVNAGDNTISSFVIERNGELSLVDVVSSGGVMPNALAEFGSILYVSNRGEATTQAPSNITGFQIDCCGRLNRIPYARYMLSSVDAKPACLAFHPNGTKLVVSELSTNQLYVFSLCCDGSLIQGTINHASGPGPFGLRYLENGVLLVAEAGDGALSSYCSRDRRQLEIISGSIMNGQKATCWVTTNGDQRVAYTSNAGSGTISIYDIYEDGTLTLRTNVSTNPSGGAAPIDIAVSCDGTFLYALNGNEGSISVFEISEDGNLSLLHVVNHTGLPTIGAQGLATL